MVRPIVEYACVLFDNCKLQESKLLESVQLNAARICTGAMWNTSNVKLLDELGWATLSERRKYFKLLLFFKILNKQVPDYLSSIELPMVSHIAKIDLRNAGNIQSIRARTNMYKFSYFPSTIDIWNSLPLTLRNIQELLAFKKLLISTLFPIRSPTYFNIGYRFPSIWHTQIRMGHSKLKYHTYMYNLSDNDLCDCGSTETTEHYFLVCPRYAAQRIGLLTSIASLVMPGVHYSVLSQIKKDYIIDIILRGSSDLSISDNFELFKAVQTFIDRSKRFS